ncbi:lytic polysaccharide monooxygenase [Zopfia rhizophila CBS 207.26]|uniref:AA9 family lytic polysaccharide monooxygenase n=1 Tax=Zopfia rhizophila CBS 207.26 TaxID=1314779 RepID=A0A6A6DPR8_9PEZI|nr:lytic polysaccharide monooxygenase [Zopfia rhizophila CBS 207.26]
MSLKIQAAALLGALATTVKAHGHVTGVVADGTYYQGYDPSFQYQQTPPKVVGWSCPQCLDNGFVDPPMYSNSNIACHKSATAGQAVAKVAAGGTVELQWTEWPESHHGPVLDYLAKCAGDDCTTETADALSFFKVQESGLIDGSAAPGKWASDDLIANNNTWSVKIPSSIAAGQYVLRHEIIALHSAGQENGAQNYPQCINIEVTGGGSANPTGVKATEFYTPDDAGIKVSIYSAPLTYEIPGPALFDGAEAAPSQGAGSSASAAPSSAPAATSAAASSAVTAAPVASSSQVAAVEVSSTPVAPVTTAVAIPTSEVAPPVISQIANITAAVPSGLLTSALPTAVPTAGNISGPVPTTPLPEGITLKDLLDWISYIMRDFFHKAGKNGKGRKHPRQW